MPVNPETTSADEARRLEPPRDFELIERVRVVIEVRGGLPRGLVRVSEEEGAVVLEGELTRFYDRQVAVACARHVPGVRRVIDRITVQTPAPRPPAKG